MTHPKPPQLRMRLANLDDLPQAELPPSYELTLFQPGDEDEWIQLLNSTLALGAWDTHRVQQLFTGSPARVVPEGIHFIRHQDEAVATACLTEHDDMEDAELGWVAVSPQHQGMGLGRQVCLATLAYMRRRGYRAAILLTDDFRLPAIKTYLHIGFRPQLVHESHKERWREVLYRLDMADLVPEEELCHDQPDPGAIPESL